MRGRTYVGRTAYVHVCEISRSGNGADFQCVHPP